MQKRLKIARSRDQEDYVLIEGFSWKDRWFCIIKKDIFEIAKWAEASKQKYIFIEKTGNGKGDGERGFSLWWVLI